MEFDAVLAQAQEKLAIMNNIIETLEKQDSYIAHQTKVKNYSFEDMVKLLSNMEIDDIAEAYWQSMAEIDANAPLPLEQWLKEAAFNDEMEDLLDSMFGEDETDEFFKNADV